MSIFRENRIRQGKGEGRGLIQFMAVAVVTLFGGLQCWTQDDRPEHRVQIPEEGCILSEFLRTFAQDYLTPTGRRHFLDEHQAIKTGILIMINDIDLSLIQEDGQEVRIKDGDEIQFITTLHGG